MNTLRFIAVRLQQALFRLTATRCGLAGSLLAFCGLLCLCAVLPDLSWENAFRPALFLVPAALLFASHAAALRGDRLLIENGMTVSGHIDGESEGVRMHSGTALFTRTFALRFHYTVDGVRYDGRSRYYWVRPLLPADGRVTVYVDPADPRRCALDL
ncbi:MAG: hypothetical protein DBX91_10610 [Subdoligranulum variabile]|nr:MAG: hypothetical protein DBX91_10610 [Subdoligranulum variabile]